MQHSAKNTRKIAYTFAGGGLLFIIAFTVVILINNKTFVDRVHYRTVLNNAKGLSAKPAIFFKGLEIGRISKFKLNEITNDIEVNFYIFSKYQTRQN